MSSTDVIDYALNGRYSFSKSRFCIIFINNENIFWINFRKNFYRMRCYYNL